MRVALTSDLHGMLPERVPACDAIVIAGDICPDVRDQRKWLTTTFAQWCQPLSIANVEIYLTWGNHDWTQKMMREVEEYLPVNVHVVVDRMVKIGERWVWFSPWVVNLPMWAWNCGEQALFERLQKVPETCDIVVSHTPPFGAGDKLRGHSHIGSEALAEWLSKREKPMFVVCGHIHEARGLDHVLWQHKVWNVSSVNSWYEPHEDRFFVVEW